MSWILTNVVMKAESAAVFTLASGLVTTLILMPFRNALRKIWRAVDSLDPQTDTGVTGDLKRLEKKLASLDPDSHQHVPDPPAKR